MHSREDLIFFPKVIKFWKSFLNIFVLKTKVQKRLGDVLFFLLDTIVFLKQTPSDVFKRQIKFRNRKVFWNSKQTTLDSRLLNSYCVILFQNLMLKDLLMARHWLGTWGWRLPLTQQSNVPLKRFWFFSLVFIIVVLTFFWYAGRGLEYLHEHCYPAVIHRDMKSSNILLDANFNAKVRKSH